MQATDKKELRVSSYDSPQKVMYQIKEFLLPIEKGDISSGTKSSGTAARAVESLKRLGYITVENVQTLTIVEEGHRIIKMLFTVKKTAQFKKLYDEHEELRKKKEEERNDVQQKHQHLLRCPGSPAHLPAAGAGTHFRL